MALIAIVDGAKLYMYPNDHPPPHFHILIVGHHAVIDVRTLKLIKGEVPKAKLGGILKWARRRRPQLLEAWDITQSLELPEKIQ